jgi:hypothetical protein
VSDFGIASIVFALVGAVVYFGIVYFAGRKRWWWLALLVSLPDVRHNHIFFAYAP